MDGVISSVTNYDFIALIVTEWIQIGVWNNDAMTHVVTKFHIWLDTE